MHFRPLDLDQSYIENEFTNCLYYYHINDIEVVQTIVVKNYLSSL